MKKTTLKSVLVLAFLSLMTFQAKSQKDEIQLIQAMWGMEKKAIVTDYMKLTAPEATGFWPVYEEYQTELQALGKARLLIIAEYGNSAANLTDLKADELMVRALKNNAQTDKLQAKYYKKLKKVITATRAAQFMQLDYYLLTAIRAEMQSAIPLIGELDKKAK